MSTATRQRRVLFTARQLLVAILFVAIFAMAVRPQIVSLPLAAVVAFLLDCYKRSGSSAWLWPLPLLVALWINCHGGFVIAFILMRRYLAGETLNRLTTRTGLLDTMLAEKPGWSVIHRDDLAMIYQREESMP